MLTDEDDQIMRLFWQRACEDLDVELCAPFVLRFEERQHHCIAHLPAFGGAKGVIIVGTTAPEFTIDSVLIDDAESAGYACSHLNVETYKSYSRALAIETLADWGYFGDASHRPSWLEM